VNIQVWTDTDLHGAGGALILRWLYKNSETFNIIDVTESTFTGRFKGVELTLDHYDRIFIVDLDLNEDQIKLVDRENVVVIDTHTNHFNNKHLYKNSKVILDNSFYSCVHLIREKFKDHLKLTDEQEKLIEIISQYDWYKSNNESLKLNAIYYNLNAPKTENFISNFYNGLTNFTVQQKNSIKLFFKKFKEQVSSNNIFKGKIKDYNVVATFGDYAVGELAHFLLSKYDADISIIVNTKTKTVSFRRKKDTNIDVSLLAKKLCDGGGHSGAAGGKLTDRFTTLTKQFTQC
jgi:oligoribonuclease NrnB/cAMP/cGMP phosphodiesterase (DHH superfamily)|tara:strand:+ start:160 stop:1029 length:870 start_codon:yes stop_codon:yes gene_type:complete